MSTRRSANERRSARARAIFQIFVFDEGVEIEVVKDNGVIHTRKPVHKKAPRLTFTREGADHEG